MEHLRTATTSQLFAEYIPPECGGPEPTDPENPHYVGTYTLADGTIDLWFFQTAEAAHEKLADLVAAGCAIEGAQ